MIREEAPALREAGVLELEFDGVRVTLAPCAPSTSTRESADTGEAEKAPAKESQPVPDAGVSPLDDPSTWGLPHDAKIPGLRRPVKREDA